MQRILLLIFFSLFFYCHSRSQGLTFYYYPRYNTLYAVEKATWIYYDNDKWMLSHFPPSKMPMIKIEKDRKPILTYTGPNPFLYHFVLHSHTSKQHGSPAKSKYWFKLKTHWGVKNDSLKIHTTYTGRVTREFNK